MMAFFEDLAEEEAAVLRECVYALQGISGERIKFYWKKNISRITGGGISTDDDYADRLRQLSIRRRGLSREEDREEEEGVRVRSPAVLVDGGKKIPPTIPPSFLPRSLLGSGAADGLRICGEAGWLYARVQAFVDDIVATTTTTTDSASSAIARALACAMDAELQSYRTWLSVLEASMTQQRNRNLRWLVIEIQPCLPRLKTLAAVTDGLLLGAPTETVEEKRGGGERRTRRRLQGCDILTQLYRHGRQHGDTRHATLIRHLFDQASRPWIDMLQLWIRQGRLVTSSSSAKSTTGASTDEGEFFVVDNDANRSSNARKEGDDKYLWRDRFRLDRNKVPMGVIDKDLIEPVFGIGKGINYIQRLLDGAGWSLDGEEDLETAGATPMTTGNDGDEDARKDNLRRQIENSARAVHTHILRSLRQDHSLMGHLFALKQFLLLGQGDFFSSLMDGMYAEYGQLPGIVGVHRHNLWSIVESALKNTNASSFSSDIIERLDVELLVDKDDDYNFMFGESKDDDAATDTRTVWDVFSLSYSVPDPLVAIVPPSTMTLYKKLFSFLFGLRKVSYSLTSTWRQSAVLQHALQTAAQRNAVSVATSPTYAQANVLLRKISMTRQSMMHFVTNLTSYLMFEVLEGGWKDLVHRIDAADTLDEVIEAHDDYVSGMCQKSLLPNASGGEGDDDDRSDRLGDGVQELVLLVGNFCDYQERLFGTALEEADRAAEKRRLAEERVTRGDWGFQQGGPETAADEEETFFGLADASKVEELDALSSMFNERVLVLLESLDGLLNGSPTTTKLPFSTTTSPLPTTPDSSSTSTFQRRLKRSSAAAAAAREQRRYYDLDSLRFLALQLDQNNFYASQQQRQKQQTAKAAR